MIDLPTLEANHADDVARIRKLTNAFYSMNAVEYAYRRLREISVEATIESLLENETLTTALVIAYGRLFNSSDGVTKLSAAVIPGELRSTHDEIIELRNKRYAHHGAHHSISVSTSTSIDGNEVVLDQQIEFEGWFGAAKHWEPLIIWLREYLHARVHSQLTHLSQKSGVRWKMNSGPPPSWVVQPDVP